MKKPNQEAINLVMFGPVIGIRVEHRQTGTDTAETYLHLKNREGKVSVVKAPTFHRFMDLHLDHYRIARVKTDVQETVEEWQKFEKQHRAEIREYERLKAKFG